MNKYFKIALTIGIVAALVAFTVAPPKRATAPAYFKYGATTLTNASTVYHTLENSAGDDLWFTDADALSVQIYFNETSGSSSTVLTVQGTNGIDEVSPRWVDIKAITAWTADEDTLLIIDNDYGLYRLKWAQTGTATAEVSSWWTVGAAD